MFQLLDNIRRQKVLLKYTEGTINQLLLGGAKQCYFCFVFSLKEIPVQWNSRLCLCFQVSSPWMWWSGSHNGQICITPQRIRLPSSGQTTEGWLYQWIPVHMEGWEDGWHVVSHSRLWRLWTRQRQFPDPQKVKQTNKSLKLLLKCILNVVKSNRKSKSQLNTSEKVGLFINFFHVTKSNRLYD